MGAIHKLRHILRGKWSPKCDTAIQGVRCPKFDITFENILEYNI